MARNGKAITRWEQRNQCRVYGINATVGIASLDVPVSPIKVFTDKLLSTVRGQRGRPFRMIPPDTINSWNSEERSNQREDRVKSNSFKILSLFSILYSKWWNNWISPAGYSAFWVTLRNTQSNLTIFARGRVSSNWFRPEIAWCRELQLKNYNLPNVFLNSFIFRYYANEISNEAHTMNGSVRCK